jgi:SAM-dependent methyltransferase
LEKVSSAVTRKPKDAVAAESLLNLPFARVAEGENVFQYAQRVLVSLIAVKPPDFPKRIKAINQRELRPVRILSLCSGAAGIERQILTKAACPVEITLFDLNEKLMREAAASLSSIADTSGFLGDVNELSVAQFGEGTFDIVMFVSGLHHVVEIEHVLQGIAGLLVSNGEFWIVGEAIGRNGNRLWPEALEAANLVFSPLPECYRRNAFTGKVDSTLPETDFSAASFEGIRSEEIESLLLRYLDPVEMWRGNCFLWRLVNPAYFRNYDLRNHEDRYVVLSFVAAEYNLWKSGGRPAQSYSVYRKR